MSERSPSTYPSYKPDPVTARDGRRRIGLNPAEGDLGTAEAPREPRQASLSTQPDEGRDTALGECVATAERCGMTRRHMPQAGRRSGQSRFDPVESALPRRRPLAGRRIGS